MKQSGYELHDNELDAIFSALSDPTRRAILSRLSEGEASVAEIAALFDISQPAISRHLKVLKRAGLVQRDIDRQRRPARLHAANMSIAADWLDQFRAFWEGSFENLDALLVTMKNSAATNNQNRE